MIILFPGGIKIIQGPESLEAMIGDTVTFRCVYTGTVDLPYWSIGGTDYSVIDLPRGYRYTFGGLQVHLEEVLSLKNNTEYSCFFFEFVAMCSDFRRVESSHAVMAIDRSK